MRANWVQEEIDLLIKLYPIKTAKELAEFFPQYNNTQLIRKAKQLKLKKKPEITKKSRVQASLEARNDLWSDDEKRIIIEHYSTEGAKGTQKIIQEKFNYKRPLDDIKKHAYRLGLKRTQKTQMWELIDAKLVNDDFISIEAVFKGK